MTWGYTESGTPRHREGHDGYIDGIQHRDVDKRQRECSHYESRYGRDRYPVRLGSPRPATTLRPGSPSP